jgi:hypothetical protein
MARFHVHLCRANGTRETLHCMTARLAYDTARHAMRNGAQWAEVCTGPIATLTIFED